MQFKTFVLNVLADSEAEEALNKFLRSHRCLRVERQLVDDNWCFLVEYQEGGDKSFAPRTRKGNKKDPTEGLTTKVKERFVKLPEIRRQSIRSIRAIRG